MRKRMAVLAAALCLLGTSIPVQASASGAYVPDVQSEKPAKEQMLEALDFLRDHGLSVIGMTDKVLGTSVLTDIETRTGDTIADTLQEAASAAGSDAADAARQAGENAVGAAQDAARETTQSFFDTLREKIADFFASLFTPTT
ncbi:MAG: hypothetical protein ACI4OJ_01235 [Lachnospiraceae bacterium]